MESSTELIMSTGEEVIQDALTSSSSTSVTIEESASTMYREQSRHSTSVQDDVFQSSILREPLINRRSHDRSTSIKLYRASLETVFCTPGVMTTQLSHAEEKKEMQFLNERFANHIDKVHFFAWQNEQLEKEVNSLKDKLGKEWNEVKVQIMRELDQVRRRLENANGENAKLVQRVAILEVEVKENRQRADDKAKEAQQEREKNELMIVQLRDIEEECNILRRRVESHDKQRDKDRLVIAGLSEKYQEAKKNWESEMLKRLNEESRRMTLEEELQFIQIKHEHELKEQAVVTYHNTTSDNRRYWKRELGEALRCIQELYDDRIYSISEELDSTYSLKLKEFMSRVTTENIGTDRFKEENRRLSAQMSTLRDELSNLKIQNDKLARDLETKCHEKEEIEISRREKETELQYFVAEMEAIRKKLEQFGNTSSTYESLEAEIMAYRKLLEIVERSCSFRLRDVITQEQLNTFRQTEVTSGDSTKVVSLVEKSEMSARTTYQRTAKGPVAITDIEVGGKFVMIENTGHKEEQLGEWHLKRSIDGKDDVEYEFPMAFVLAPGDKIKIWANGAKPSDAEQRDLEADVPSWGTGNYITTKLVNPANEDRATHIQRTTYA